MSRVKYWPLYLPYVTGWLFGWLVRAWLMTKAACLQGWDDGRII